MRLRRFLPVLALLLASCGSVVPVVDPVGPTPPAPTPVEPVPPTPPVPPVPVPAEKVVPYATAHAIVDGASRTSVEASIGFPPMKSSRQDDGTTISRWAALGSTGAAKWLDVVYGANGLVLGKALLPR